MCYLPFMLLIQVPCPTLVMLMRSSIDIVPSALRKHAVYLNDIGTLFQQQGELDRALELYQQALQGFVTAADYAGVGRVLNNLGLTYGQQGRIDRMRSLCLAAAGVLEEAGDQAGEAMALHNAGTAYTLLGSYDQARRSIEKAIAIRVAIADLAGEATSFRILGKIYEHLGQPEYAMCCYHEARELCLELGDREALSERYRAGEALNLSAIALLYQQEDLPFSAIHWHQQALAIFDLLEDNQQQAESNRFPATRAQRSISYRKQRRFSARRIPRSQPQPIR